MKKICFIVFSLVLVHIVGLQVSLSAAEDISKPLVIIRGEYNYDLTYDNYSLISSNLNTSVVGKYLNVYQHYQTNEFVYKDIYVVDENCVNGDIVNIEYETFIHNNQNIVKYIQISENKYVYIYTVDNNTTEEGRIDIHLTLVEGNTVVWDNIIFENYLAEIVDLQVNNNEIYTMINFYSSYSKMDIYIKKISLEGKYVYSYIYSGDKNDLSTKLFIDENQCYIVGNTTSEKRFCEGEREQEDSFLLVIDKLKFEKFSEYTFGCSGVDNIEEIFVDDNYIYLIQQYLNPNKGNLPSIKCIQLTLDGTYVKEKELISGYGLKVVDVSEYDIYSFIVVYEYYNESKKMYQTNVVSVNNNLNHVVKYHYNYNNDCHLQYIYLSNTTLSLMYKLTNDQNGYLFKCVDINQNAELVNYSFGDSHFDKYYLHDNFSLFIYNEDKLYISDMTLLDIDFLGKDIVSTDEDIYKYVGYCNGIEFRHNDDRSIINIDYGMFGDYNLIYYLESDSCDLLYNKPVKVLTNLSISHNNTYDRNIRLNFTGIGILNGEQISSGHIVDEEGDYQLKLIGYNDVTYDYQFKVSKLSLDTSNVTTNEINDDSMTFIDNIIEHSDEFRFENINLDKDDNTSNNTYSWWPIFIPLSLSIVIVGVVMKGVLL